MRTIVRNPFEVEVKFSDVDLANIRRAAERRQAPKDGSTNRRIVNRDDTELHFIGLLGEFAVARLIYGTVDTNVYVGGDTGKDFSIYGSTLEVKTLQGYFTLRKIEEFTTDLAALVIYDKNDFSKVWVQGWITKKDFIEQCFTDNFGYGDRPCVQPAQLLPIVTLKQHCLTIRSVRWLLDYINSIIGVS